MEASDDQRERQEWDEIRQKVSEYVPRTERPDTFVIFDGKDKRWWKEPGGGLSKNLLAAHVYKHDEAESAPLGTKDIIMHMHEALQTNWTGLIDGRPPAGTVAGVLAHRDDGAFA